MSSTRNDRSFARKGAACLSAREYVDVMGFMGGETVEVYVEGKEKKYTLPRKLLCYHSKFFAACFEGEFKEGREGVVYMDHVKSKTFNYVIQWITTEDLSTGLWDMKDSDIKNHAPGNDSPKVTTEEANIGLDGFQLNESGPDDTGGLTKKQIAHILKKCCNIIDRYFDRDILKEYLDFLVLADEIFLCPDPTKVIVQKMKNIMADRATETLFDGVMLRKAWELPKSHPVRTLFLEGSIMRYLYAQYIAQFILTLSDSPPEPGKLDPHKDFPFSEELDSIPGYAADLLKYAINFTMSQSTAKFIGSGSWCTGYRDPLTGTFMSIRQWGKKI